MVPLHSRSPGPAAGAADGPGETSSVTSLDVATPPSSRSVMYVSWAATSRETSSAEQPRGQLGDLPVDLAAPARLQADHRAPVQDVDQVPRTLLLHRDDHLDRDERRTARTEHAAQRRI